MASTEIHVAARRSGRVRIVRVAWFEALGLGRAIGVPIVLGGSVVSLLLVLQKPLFLESNQFVTPTLDALVVGLAAFIPLVWLVLGARDRRRFLRLIDPTRTAAGWSLGILAAGVLAATPLLVFSYTVERILGSDSSSWVALLENVWRSILVLLPFAALAPAFLLFASSTPLVAVTWLMTCATSLGVLGPAGVPIPTDIFSGEFEWTDVTAIALCTLAGHVLSAVVLRGRGIPSAATAKVEID